MAPGDEPNERAALRALSIDELIAAAMALDEDDDPAEKWRYVGELQRRGDDDVFEAADTLTRSESDRERRLGTTILGQLGYEYPKAEPFATQRRRAVTRLIELSRGDDSDIAWAAINGLGDQSDIGALDAVLAHAHSSDSAIRQAVAMAFPGLTGSGGELTDISATDAERVVDALIALADDDDGDVRDWAIFALGTQYEIDTPAVRDMLARHLDDPHEHAAEEALVGLARRRDARAFPTVLAALAPDEASRLSIEAAAYLADERLLPSLLALADLWRPDEPPLREAIQACDPNAPPAS